MSRLADPLNVTASQQPHVPYVLFGDFDFVSGHVRLSTWNKSFTFGGNTYLGFGKLCGIGEVKESSGINSDKLEFTLSGLDASLITTVLAEKYHGRDATLYVAYLNPGTHDLITTPEILWEGLMDTMSIKSGADGSLISLVCENRLLLWNKPPGWMDTDEHQRYVDSTDRIFDQLAALEDKQVTWGGGTVNTGDPAPSAPPGYWDNYPNWYA